MTPAALAAAYRWACALDVAADKPGNVSLRSPGHAMEAAQFLASAEVSATAVTDPTLRVGVGIEQAIAATRAAVGCNTNLGIVLLVVPLARAALRAAPQPDATVGLRAWREAIATVLDALDVADAAAAYRAIALAAPAGLGDAPAADVTAGPPTVTLREAMALAAARDTIAAQYATGFAGVFDAAARHFGSAASTATPARAMQAVYLGWLATTPDSHIVRKQGPATAQSVTQQAAHLLQGGHPNVAALAAWDIDLKRAGVNPGTSADLSVAAAFVARVCDLPGSRGEVATTIPA